MIRLLTACALVVVVCASSAQAADKTVKQTVVSNDITRIYYLYVPDTVKGKPAPLIFLLHGSGRDAKSLMGYWEPLAKRDGIILVGPDAVDRAGWSMRHDGPHFLKHVLDDVQKKETVDPKRVYLFGHSAGAVHGLAMAILESEYFAAAAVHAGEMPKDVTPFIERAPRKIPIAIWVGTNDKFFSLTNVRATRDALNQHGFKAELTEIYTHTHDYYGRAPEINKGAWAFLQSKSLAGDPLYQEYDIPRNY